MSEACASSTDIAAVFEKGGGEGVAENVRAGPPGEAGAADGFDQSAQDFPVQRLRWRRRGLPVPWRALTDRAGYLQVARRNSARGYQYRTLISRAMLPTEASPAGPASDPRRKRGAASRCGSDSGCYLIWPRISPPGETVECTFA